MSRVFFILSALAATCMAFSPAVRPAVHSRSVALRAAAPVAELQVQDTWWCAAMPGRSLLCERMQQGKGTCKCLCGLISSLLTARWLPHRPVLRRGDKEYPPSTVLGIGKGVSSGVFGVTSAIALVVGLYCVAQSNLLNILSGSTVNGWYVAGSLLVPYSWGLHVASWIQKQNGK